MNRKPLDTRLVAVDLIAQVLLAAGIGLAASLALAGAVLLISGAGS